MVKLFKIVFCILVGGAFNILPVFASDMSQDDLIKELKAMKSRIENLSMHWSRRTQRWPQ
jgi:hypothetical protein